MQQIKKRSAWYSERVQPLWLTIEVSKYHIETAHSLIRGCYSAVGKARKAKDGTLPWALAHLAAVQRVCDIPERGYEIRGYGMKYARDYDAPDYIELSFGGAE
jgi:hypothetical protein